ncbi:MAG: hypothetical protein GY913_33610, partial [Proteobacteria bacterium]|nr:hypothetical protein [Pseudomonadota bacterium]
VVAEWDTDHGHTWTQLKTDVPNVEALYYFHNLLWAGHTTLFYLDPDKLQLRNNVLVFTDEYSDEPPSFDSDHNLLVNVTDKEWLRGEHGSWLGADPAALDLVDAAGLDFRPLATSPAVDAGVPIAGFNGKDPDVGPFELGETWDGPWPRPRETTFDCSVPERWLGVPPDLACDDEPVDTGGEVPDDSAEPSPDTEGHDTDAADTETETDEEPSDSAEPKERDGAEDEEGCGCGSAPATWAWLGGLLLALRRRRDERHPGRHARALGFTDLGDGQVLAWQETGSCTE